MRILSFLVHDMLSTPPAPVRARALKQAKAHADSNGGALPAGLDEATLCSSMQLCVLDDNSDCARCAIACFDCLNREHQVCSDAIFSHW
jgi:hypothetical protein